MPLRTERENMEYVRRLPKIYRHKEVRNKPPPLEGVKLHSVERSPGRLADARAVRQGWLGVGRMLHLLQPQLGRRLDNVSAGE